MAVIGTFGSFTAARLGIYASQSALNVTGNNIANINTKGYTRQRLDLVSLYSNGNIRYANSYNLNIGYGVLTEGVSQLRDPFLDIRYRNENANVGSANAKLDCLQQLAHILDEVGKGTNELSRPSSTTCSPSWKPSTARWARWSTTPPSAARPRRWSGCSTTTPRP